MQNDAQGPTNQICPVCGDNVDAYVPPVVVVMQEESGDTILRVGTCCPQCAREVAAKPTLYADAAEANRIAEGVTGFQ
jgi:hypothetical protein